MIKNERYHRFDIGVAIFLFCIGMLIGFLIFIPLLYGHF
jgi:Sec-independent protein secretion pathway component TatC